MDFQASIVQPRPLASGFPSDVLQTGRHHDIGGIDAVE
jgi:hypothetical protein